MGLWQNADFDVQRANSLGVTAIDTRLAVNDVFANGAVFDFAAGRRWFGSEPGASARPTPGQVVVVLLAAASLWGFKGVAVSDKSAPEVISNHFGVSKGNFKKAIGALYKEGKIAIHADRIELI